MCFQQRLFYGALWLKVHISCFRCKTNQKDFSQWNCVCQTAGKKPKPQDSIHKIDFHGIVYYLESCEKTVQTCCKINVNINKIGRGTV